jgi:tRNA A-37 threonylcarbamoyl transferase component Bud32
MTNSAKKANPFHVTMNAPSDPLVGTVLHGRYAIERMLGSGGMGLVYLGRHVVLKKPVAVKVLRQGVATDPEMVARFRQEAEAASAIGNPHIIDVTDFGVLDEGSTYFVMEVLDGVVLTNIILREGPMAIGRLVHIARQLCNGLAAAHRAGIVHRDMKPDNVYLVTRDGDADFVKILDFGIAKVGGVTSKLTRAGDIFGSPDYMSPEQCQGAFIDARSDIYSLGIILYELLLGRRPFDADNFAGLLEAHVFTPPLRPSLFREGCPTELEAIILRCLEKSPDARYPDCAALLADLESFAAGLPVWIPPHVKSILEADISAIYKTDKRMRRAEPAATIARHAPARPASLPAYVLALGGLACGLALAVPAAWLFLRPDPRPVDTRPLTIVIPTIPRPAMPSRSVRIETTPAAAEVLVDGQPMGVTPFDVVRPAAGARVTLLLRKAGFDEREVVVSSATLGAMLHFDLRATRAATAPSESDAPIAGAPPAAARPPSTDDEAARQRARRTTVVEVMDPWN